MGTARAPGATFAILLVGSFGLLMIALAGPGGPAPVRTAQLASVALTDDDGDQALFAATELVPGRPVSRCLEVRYAGAAGPGDVHLVAEDVTGTLADQLAVRVERGTGGGFASCAGFSGSTVFDGLLTGLGDDADVGVSTGWVPAARDNRTYRITVEVPAGTVPGRTAGATFRWLVVPGPPPPATTPPTPEPTSSTTTPPTATPSTVPTTAAPSTAATAAAPSTRPASAAPSAGTVHHTPKGPGGSGGQQRRPGGGLSAAVRQAISDAFKLAEGSARHGGVPILALVALILFVLVQDQIDRRDPKLALAPMLGDPYLYFGDEHDDTGGSP